MGSENLDLVGTMQQNMGDGMNGRRRIEQNEIVDGLAKIHGLRDDIFSVCSKLIEKAHQMGAVELQEALQNELFLSVEMSLLDEAFERWLGLAQEAGE